MLKLSKNKIKSPYFRICVYHGESEKELVKKLKSDHNGVLKDCCGSPTLGTILVGTDMKNTLFDGSVSVFHGYTVQYVDEKASEIRLR